VLSLSIFNRLFAHEKYWHSDAGSESGAGVILTLATCRADILVQMAPEYSRVPFQGQFTTAFVLNEYGDNTAGAIDATILYDPSVVQIVDVSAPQGSAWGGNLFVDRTSFQSGQTRIAGSKRGKGLLRMVAIRL